MVMIVTWKIDYNGKISYGRLEQMNTKRDCNYDAQEKRKEKQNSLCADFRPLWYECLSYTMRLSSRRVDCEFFLSFLLLLQLFTGCIMRCAHLRCDAWEQKRKCRIMNEMIEWNAPTITKLLKNTLKQHTIPYLIPSHCFELSEFSG